MFYFCNVSSLLFHRLQTLHYKLFFSFLVVSAFLSIFVHTTFDETSSSLSLSLAVFTLNCFAFKPWLNLTLSIIKTVASF